MNGAFTHLRQRIASQSTRLPPTEQEIQVFAPSRASTFYHSPALQGTYVNKPFSTLLPLLTVIDDRRVKWFSVRASIISIAILLSSCLFDHADSDPPVLPAENAGKYRLLPNDPSPQDSAVRQLAEGVVIPAFPSAAYTLSFHADSTPIPPKLRLYKLYSLGDQYGYTNDQVITAKRNGQSWVYSFQTSAPSVFYWLTVLEHNGERYQGQLSNVHLSAIGAYSEHLDINLWIAGKFVSSHRDQTPEKLASTISQTIRSIYHSSGVVLDSIFVGYAHQHPTIGAQFPSNKELITSGISSRFDSLGYNLSGRRSRALDLVIVYAFDTPGMLGESPLFGSNLQEGASGSVLLATHRKGSATGGYTPISFGEIAITAAHEIGHFFGLRHTTTTERDREASGDYSEWHDYLGDTPYCNILLPKPSSSILAKVNNVHNRLYASTGSLCPDANNLMFPFSTDNLVEGLSTDQGRLLLLNLRLFPH